MIRKRPVFRAQPRASQQCSSASPKQHSDVPIPDAPQFRGNCRELGLGDALNREHDLISQYPTEKENQDV